MAKKQNSRSPMEYALQYLTSKDRTVSEMQAYLDEKEFGEADVDATIERLVENGLLNDQKYAKSFVEARLRTKPLSRSHLYQQLRQHGIAQELIEEALSEVASETEEENARLLAEKYLRQYASLDAEQRRQRVHRRLVSRGFSYDNVRRAYEAAEEALRTEEME